jgi:4-nitrophenyl phosphatase
MRKDTILRSIHAILIDMDGTLLQGTNPMPGLVPFFEFLIANQISFLVATNNSTESARIYQERLAGFGVQIDLRNILTVSWATAEYLKHRLDPGARVFMVGQAGLSESLEGAGFILLPDSRLDAAAVVIGGDPELTYEKLKHASLLIQRGSLFIGTNPDVVYPTEEGLVPECGTTLAALQAATGVSPIVIGKPNRYFFELGMQRMNANAGQTAIIGDRLETDIAGGQAVGLKGIFVTTGVDDEANIPIKGIQPNLVVHSLAELRVRWEKELFSV